MFYFIFFLPHFEHILFIVTQFMDIWVNNSNQGGLNLAKCQFTQIIGIVSWTGSKSFKCSLSLACLLCMFYLMKWLNKCSSLSGEDIFPVETGSLGATHQMTCTIFKKSVGLLHHIHILWFATFGGGKSLSRVHLIGQKSGESICFYSVFSGLDPFKRKIVNFRYCYLLKVNLLHSF